MTNAVRAVEALAGIPVLCIGDVMLDRYIYGAVERISPEAPIPVLRIEQQRCMLGGAGNVAVNLAALGTLPRFVSVVGDDDAGAQILRELVERNLAESCHMATEGGRSTSVKTRYVAGNQQLLRADSETIAPIGPESLEQLLAASLALLEEARCVVLSDYAKGVLTEDVLQSVIGAATAAGRPVIVDPKGCDYRRYRGATVVTPNRRELALATSLPVRNDAEVEAAARRVIETCGIGAVVATRGEEGMSVIPADGPALHLPAEAREVFDVSGAGDTVIAVLSAALGAGLALGEAAHLANVAAGVVVGKLGTAAVEADELVAALHREEWNLGESKVVSPDKALGWIARWRRQGARIGFTNGCFDLLHPGHVALLAQARAACDRLVVGLNSDDSVKRLKGPQRPVQTESARAIVLASLAGVDLVVIFDEDTPIRLIETFRPELLVKGRDYQLDQVVGGAFVQSYGGRVLLADLEPGQSTTATIARLRQE